MRHAKLLLSLALLAAICVPAEGAEPPAGNPGSIWGGSNMMRDRKFKKHDLIMITISDNTKVGTKLESTLQRQTNFSLDVAKAFQPIRTKNGLSYEQLSATGKRPDIDIQGSNQHTGTGEIKTKDEFSARITAEVVEILPNGQLVLEARKRVKIGEEVNTLVLTGRIRPEDVGTDNSVVSDRVADPSIQYNPDGATGDANKRSWLKRLFDFVNIF